MPKAKPEVQMKRILLVILFLLGSVKGFAADTYLDDRSTPESLIRSLYSAINLHQYGRAYDYFAEAPAKDFATYAMGFESTDHVDLLVGQAGGDGAAGSVYYNMPVALRSKARDGTLSYFAGCYTIRVINADQDPPYRPLQIQSHKLKPIKSDDYVTYALPKCSDIPGSEATLPTDKAELIAKAKAQFIAEASAQCDKLGEIQGGLVEPEVNVISYRLKSDEAKAAIRQATLFSFVCSMAAYNETDVFYLADDLNGMRRLSFAEPQFDYTYLDQESAKLKSMNLIGFSASAELTNAAYDPKTKRISDFAKWRGIGDASSSGEWQFVDGAFSLLNYSVDPTYDDKVNPISVIKNGVVVFKP